ncbi:hypothetical protein SDC9_71077 [bioreactor metagenome]|uniref:Uncharacterized protein n=1 Tax=bioreactor metagenome TaxID=1076179 RepID=A0A644YEK5_9ZZZZ
MIAAFAGMDVHLRQSKIGNLRAVLFELIAEGFHQFRRVAVFAGAAHEDADVHSCFLSIIILL